jgi:hypothetical protein
MCRQTHSQWAEGPFYLALLIGASLTLFSCHSPSLRRYVILCLVVHALLHAYMLGSRGDRGGTIRHGKVMQLRQSHAL